MIDDILESYFENENIEQISRDIITHIYGDNDLYELVINLLKGLDSTYIQQVEEHIQQIGKE